MRQSSVRGCRFSFVFVYFIIKVLNVRRFPASFSPYLRTKIQAWSSLVFHCRHSSFNPSEAPPWDSRPVSGAGVVHYHLLHRPRSVPTALGPAPLATHDIYCYHGIKLLISWYTILVYRPTLDQLMRLSLNWTTLVVLYVFFWSAKLKQFMKVICLWTWLLLLAAHEDNSIETHIIPHSIWTAILSKI